MESVRSMAELGEWNSFNGVSINDEVDFIARLFPNSSLSNDLDSSSNIQALSSSTCWTNSDININIAGYYHEINTPFYSSDHTNSSSFYSNFSQGSCNNYDNTNIYLREDNNQFLEPNTDSLPFDFIMNGANPAYSEVPDTNLQLKRDYEMSETETVVAEEKIISSDISENSRKKYRVSDNLQKGKRMTRPKKNQKLTYADEENDDEAVLNRENSSSCSSQDDLNGSQEETQLSGKSRASRGSATDPQSIYARKRRERINERLRILQNLVPNGTKVDISTMLEEAVRYVKFLQLQIKLLSSDETWMYAPLAYNGMDIGLDTLNIMLNKSKST